MLISFSFFYFMDRQKAFFFAWHFVTFPRDCYFCIWFEWKHETNWKEEFFFLWYQKWSESERERKCWERAFFALNFQFSASSTFRRNFFISCSIFSCLLCFSKNKFFLFWGKILLLNSLSRKHASGYSAMTTYYSHAKNCSRVPKKKFFLSRHVFETNHSINSQ